MLKISNLSKSYGSKNVINELNLELTKGTIFGLVGINGAGKSTLLRLIAGVLIEEEGEILFNDEVIIDNEEFKKDLFFLPDDPYYNSNTTGRTLINLYKAFYDFDDEVFNSIVNTFKLDLKEAIHNFSKGMRRQLYVAIAIACRPKLLLLDEAFDGLDPKARLIFKRLLIQLVEEKETIIIISSHSLRELEDICDSFGLLDGGDFKTSGVISETLDEIHKYQLAFKDEITKERFSSINALNIEVMGRVAKIVLKGSIDDNKALLEKFNPLFIEVIPVDFEELFIYEVEGK